MQLAAMQTHEEGISRISVIPEKPHIANAESGVPPQISGG